MKEIVGNKSVTNAPLPNFITVKNREIFDKKEIVESFDNYFADVVKRVQMKYLLF